MERKGLKRVLVITYEFPPMGGIASIWLAKYVKFLPEFGWEPVVVTVRDAPTNIPDPALLEELPQGLDIRRCYSLEPTRLVRLIKNLRGREEEASQDRGQGNVVYSYTGLPFALVTRIKALFVPDEKIGWFPFALSAALRAVREGGVELIFSSSPPATAHLVAQACKRLTGLPWVSEFRDPWVDYTHHRPLTSLHQWINRRLEGSMVRGSDAVVCAFEGLAQGFIDRYGEQGEGHYHEITGGFDPGDFYGGVTMQSKFTATWIGSVYSDRCPHGLLRAVRDMLDRGLIDGEYFTLLFVGTMDVESRRAVMEAGLGDVVEMTGFVSYQESIRRMRSSHLLLLQVAEGRESEMVYVGKMFEYFGAGRPILALAGEGATTRLVERMHAGIVANPRDVEAIREAIMYYYTLYRAGEEFRVDHPDIPKMFDREKQTARLASIFDRVTVTG